MKIAVAGLGLIGGSFAKAFKENNNTLYCLDRSEETIARARLEDAMDEHLTKENIGECDFIFVALYPKATEDFLREYAPFISKDAIVIDCGGVKNEICKTGFEIAEEYGFRFIGGHPMAGKEVAGYANAASSLFDGASMILCRDDYTDEDAITEAADFFPRLFRQIRTDDLIRSDNA